MQVKWNCTSLLTSLTEANPTITLISDASGKWGCGAFWANISKLQWVGPIIDSRITVKELTPIVIAAAMWGPRWQGQTVLVRCDIAAVVSIVNQGTSKNEEAMHLSFSFS